MAARLALVYINGGQFLGLIELAQLDCENKRAQHRCCHRTNADKDRRGTIQHNCIDEKLLQQMLPPRRVEPGSDRGTYTERHEARYSKNSGDSKGYAAWQNDEGYHSII